MKLLKDYTDQELIALTPEETNTLHLLELADRGIPLPDALPEFLQDPVEKLEWAPDSAVFVIGVDYHEICFTDRREADEAMTILQSSAVKAAYNYRDRRKVYHLSSKLEVTMEEQPAYSEKKWSELRTEIQAFNQNAAKVKENNKTRKNMQDQQDAVANEISNAIYYAQQRINAQGRLKSLFEKYMSMADNQHHVAVKFFLSAHLNDVEDSEDEVLVSIGITRQDIENYLQPSEEAMEIVVRNSSEEELL
jgi:hypothetical protein